MNEDLLQILLHQPIILIDSYDTLSSFLTQCLQCILAIVTFKKSEYAICSVVMKCIGSMPNALSVAFRKCSNASAMRVTSSTLYNS